MTHPGAITQDHARQPGLWKEIVLSLANKAMNYTCRSAGLVRSLLVFDSDFSCTIRIHWISGSGRPDVYDADCDARDVFNFCETSTAHGAEKERP